ncbi:hypothetical protein [Salinimicrobium soli]|uniref:hypothetical protein n=1 Tax=Salinimicrobium soli TaxID=1254399 RepID=UPI003AAE7605
MKKLMAGLLLICFTGVMQAQIEELKEATIDYRPVSMKLDPGTQSVTIDIPEEYVGEFQSNPLDFAKRKFNVNQLIQENKGSDYTDFQVFFNTDKGYMVANYDDEGELVSTFQRFKDAALPDDARKEIMKKIKGAQVMDVRHIVISDGWNIDKEYYKVKIKDGDKVKRVRLNKTNRGISLAGY